MEAYSMWRYDAHTEQQGVLKQVLKQVLTYLPLQLFLVVQKHAQSSTKCFSFQLAVKQLIAQVLQLTHTALRISAAAVDGEAVVHSLSMVNTVSSLF